MSTEREAIDLITRREAIRRVSALLGGVALVGGNALLTGCRENGANGDTAAADARPFTAEEIAFLDEVAETILPATQTPGAKAAQTGAFMALMVTDTYDARDQKIFRDGMNTLDEASQKMHNASFMASTPQQRLALLQQIDREQKTYMDQRDEAGRRKKEEAAAARRGTGVGADTGTAEGKTGDKYVPDQRQENAPGAEAGTAAGVITADAPPHYFRMMKELALLGYFTSEIGYTQAMRYIESPGRFDPCTPHTPGETAWAPHA